MANYDVVSIEKHISVDVEAFASAPDASIASIGAVAARRGEPEDKWSSFYAVVDDPDGRFDTSTIRWHAAQENTLENIGAEQIAVPLGRSLERFANWLFRHKSNMEGACRIWSHATFDIPVLISGYRRAGSEVVPWNYRNCADLRTLYWMSGGRPKVEHEGKHHALHDAEAQLKEVFECLRRIEA